MSNGTQRGNVWSLGKFVPAAITTCGLALMLGCPDQGQTYRELDKKDDVTNTAPADHHHDHGAGPHGGHIIELGKYHGEVTVSPERIITLFILGGDAKTAVPLAKATASLHAHLGMEEKEIPLTASPQEGETDGKTSRFIAVAEIVPESIKDIEDLKGEVILIEGEEKSVGPITHDHDHEHEHEHKEAAPAKM
ncbi:hypothetical protein [Planctomicrobium piriforme]|uniref:Uncharacterized protein n=1 Tax=Planctomicrobium piriforme TaxID=1576369 RepID=A0A1I3N7K2_9PLAN|nr:hypothetical protein [Planctomicrobium piriforme]SFJ05152.1 hypothetical protein SAMN05421753_11515 [Planctomicrobium piriforme]